MLVKQKENWKLNQMSLRALFHAPLQLLYLQFLSILLLFVALLPCFYCLLPNRACVMNHTFVLVYYVFLVCLLVSVQTLGTVDGSFPCCQWQVPSTNMERADVAPCKLTCLCLLMLGLIFAFILCLCVPLFSFKLMKGCMEKSRK